MLPTCNISPYEANEVNESDVGKIGSLHTHNGMIWMAVKNDSADTDAIAGQLAAPDLAGEVGKVTMKDSEALDGTLGSVTKAAGMWGAAVAFGRFGYVLVDGWTVDADGAAMGVTAGSVAKGDPLVLAGPPGTLTFLFEKAGAGEEHAVIAHAWADDTAGDKVIARIKC